MTQFLDENKKPLINAQKRLSLSLLPPASNFGRAVEPQRVVFDISPQVLLKEGRDVSRSVGHRARTKYLLDNFAQQFMSCVLD